MTKTTKWSEIRDRRLGEPEHEAAYASARAALDAELLAHRQSLGALRRARTLTQVQLAKTLDVTQAQVSRIEHQADLYLSTLRSYLQAMGAELELIARFEDGTRVELALAELTEPLSPPSRDVDTSSGTLRPSVPKFSGGGVMSPRNERHVVSNPEGGWDVKAPGSTRRSSHHGTQADAINRAREIVGNSGGGEIVIHGRDGRIRDSDTVAPGNDPNPPRDRR